MGSIPTGYYDPWGDFSSTPGGIDVNSGLPGYGPWNLPPGLTLYDLITDPSYSGYDWMYYGLLPSPEENPDDWWNYIPIDVPLPPFGTGSGQETGAPVPVSGKPPYTEEQPSRTEKGKPVYTSTTTEDEWKQRGKDAGMSDAEIAAALAAGGVAALGTAVIIAENPGPGTPGSGGWNWENVDVPEITTPIEAPIPPTVEPVMPPPSSETPAPIFRTTVYGRSPDPWGNTVTPIEYPIPTEITQRPVTTPGRTVTPIESPIPTELSPAEIPPEPATTTPKPGFDLGDLLAALPSGQGGGINFPNIGFPVVGSSNMLQSLFPLPPTFGPIVAPPDLGALIGRR